jgi:hypothetical protein
MKYDLYLAGVRTVSDINIAFTPINEDKHGIK